MNAFDYFFENTADSNKLFLVGKDELSFQTFYNDSLLLSEFIKKKIGQGNNIILASPNNKFFIISYLAILKSGNTCVPLDPMIAQDKFNHIRKLTNSSVLFSSAQFQRKMELEEDVCITSLPDFASLTIPADHISPDFNPEQCAEIIFTSGSTGSPKGVMLSHNNLIANTQSILEYLMLTENDRMLVVLPFYYCYGLSLLHTHLRIGGSVVFNNSFIFLGSIINDLRNYNCTGFAGVPSHFQILLRKSPLFKTSEFPFLRYVTQAGGKLAPVFIDEFKENKPNTQFFVMYGQTEATARLSYLPPDVYDKKKGSIGKGIPGVSLKVVNEKGEKVATGEVGELIAKGNNVMTGYFNDRLDTETTIKNGWLYTGDLGTVDDDGFIYLTARKKEIIKIGGKRISPKEIEGVILSIPEVVDCTIEGINDEMLGEAMKASIILNKENEAINKTYIKAHCGKHLELYKIPQVIDIQTQLKMSSTGKKIKS